MKFPKFNHQVPHNPATGKLQKRNRPAGIQSSTPSSAQQTANQQTKLSNGQSVNLKQVSLAQLNQLKETIEQDIQRIEQQREQAYQQPYRTYDSHMDRLTNQSETIQHRLLQQRSPALHKLIGGAASKIANSKTYDAVNTMTQHKGMTEAKHERLAAWGSQNTSDYIRHMGKYYHDQISYDQDKSEKKFSTMLEPHMASLSDIEAEISDRENRT